MDETNYRMASLEEARILKPGARHYRAYVGNPKSYDVTGAAQFSMMVALGLREDHTLLDVGCGSLCGGRLFIPYLLADRYHGIDPQEWLVEDGIKFEVTEELRRLKRPTFRFAGDFSFTEFNIPFDFMLAQSILTHVSQTQLDRCLAQAKLVLKPQGLFAASFYYNGRETYGENTWKYPGFTSYPIKFVVERAQQHNLMAYPLIWTNSYGHYWMIFAHRAEAERVAWLGDSSGEQGMLRILELTKQLSDMRQVLRKRNAELKEASLQTSGLQCGKRSADAPS